MNEREKHAWYVKKGKEVLLNIDNDTIKDDFWTFCQEHFPKEEIKTLDDAIKNLIDTNISWLEDMIEHYPSRKEYWESVIHRYDTQ